MIVRDERIDAARDEIHKRFEAAFSMEKGKKRLKLVAEITKESADFIKAHKKYYKAIRDAFHFSCEENLTEA